MKAYALILSFSLLLTGCSALHSRIKGGTIEHRSATGSVTTQTQSEDPKDRTNLSGESEKTTEVFLPAGSVVLLDAPVTSVDIPTKASFSTNRVISIVLSSNAFMRTVLKDKLNSTAGGAQKNVLAETMAKLSSMRPVQYVGIALILFAIASFAWPPLRAIIGSITTSIIIGAAGLAMIALPILLVGNELLILFIGLGVAIGYFLIYRYGTASTKAKVYKNFIDKNLDGIDDKLQQLEKKGNNQNNTK